MRQPTTKLRTLEAKAASLDGRIKTQSQHLADTRRQREVVEREIRRERLRESIGQPVRIRYRSQHHPALNDAVGILAEVRRTRCVVNYPEPIGGSTSWIFDIHDVAPVAEEQGLTIEFAAGVL